MICNFGVSPRLKKFESCQPDDVNSLRNRSDDILQLLIISESYLKPKQQPTLRG